MRARFEKLVSLYDSHPRAGAMLAGAGLLLVLTLVDALLFSTSALGVLYVLPIWLATRMGGRRSGLVLVVLCTLAGVLTDRQLGHAGADFLIRFIALGFLMMVIAQVEQGLQKHQ